MPVGYEYVELWPLIVVVFVLGVAVANDWL